ncbi:MAG: inner membrane CreD family protein [Chitinophagaceae bacterium]|nr:inner membrane CreD family protein [Chitinophagaceae bacterium]
MIVITRLSGRKVCPTLYYAHFCSFLLVETIYKRPLHLVQYGLAGLALVLFYTLLLSISEYTGFNLAYLIAGSCYYWTGRLVCGKHS